MSIDNIAPVTVRLSAAASQLPSFGTSYIFAELDSQQYAEFTVQSGGLSTLVVGANGITDTLESLKIDASQRAYEDVVAHFRGPNVPESAILTYRGTADQTHIQTITVAPESGTSDRASVGLYKLSEIEGGPYQYNSPGQQQVVNLLVADAGGGNGATGLYTVRDGDGNVYTYGSGGFNVWTTQILSVAVGLYSVTVDGNLYSYTATGSETVQQVRDALFANMIANPDPGWTFNKVSTDSITITGNNVGQSLTVTSNDGPGGTEATTTETTPIVPETQGAVATAIAAAITGASTPPEKWDPVASTVNVVITAKVAYTGVDVGISSDGPSAGDLVQTLTTDHRESVTTVRDALDTAIAAASHPTFAEATSGTDAEVLTGATAGVPVPVTVSGPNGNLTLQETQSVLTLRTAQTSRITINPNPSGGLAYEGTYQVIVFGETISYVNPSGSGNTVTQVRDGLQAAVDAAITEAAVVSISTDAFDLTSNTPGQPFQLTVTSPGSNAGATASLISAATGIRDDAARAKTDNSDGYFWLNSGTAVDIEELAGWLDDNASQYPGMQYFITEDDDVRDTPYVAGTSTDVGAVVQQTGTRRSKGVYLDSPVSSTIAYEAHHANWVGDFSVDLPGQVNPANRPLPTNSSTQQFTAQQETNLQDRNVAFLEYVPSLAARQVMSALQSAYTPSGRMVDLQRALDQILVVYQTFAADYMTGQRFISYTDRGLAFIHQNVVVPATNRLQEQGLVITDALYTNGRVPKRSDATQAEIDAGIAPLFNFTITIDLGIVQLPITVEVTQ